MMSGFIALFERVTPPKVSQGKGVFCFDLTLFQHLVSLIVMAIPVNVVVLTVANFLSSLLVTILKLNFQSKEEMKTVKKSSLSKRETQTVLHSPVSLIH